MQCPKCSRQLTIPKRFCPYCGSTLPTTTTFQSTSNVQGTGFLGELQTGMSLQQGRYVIRRKIGTGGMGTIYKATDRNRGDSFCAIKEMIDTGAGQEFQQNLATFRQEANILVNLSLPMLPAVWDYFEEGGRFYQVLEFVEGQDLGQAHPCSSLPLSEKTVVEYGLQLCAVLRYLHSQNPPIIHRDLKPSNIMRLPSDKLKLLDFGIARFFKPSQQMDTIAMGTPGYAPPEQFGSGQTDALSDLYALGVILLELATGFEPTKNPTSFQFPSARKRNPSLSKDFEQIIHRATQADRDKRYPSAAEMEQELQVVLELLNAATCPRCGTVNALRATRCRCGESLAQSHQWNWLMFRGNPRRTGFIPVEISFPLNPRWHYRGNGAWNASPVIANGIAYCCDTGGYCSALVLTNGNRHFKIHLGAPIRSTPAVAEGNLYVSTEAGELVCLNAQNAQIQWQWRLGGKTIVSPLVDNQQVYIGDESGKVATYSAQTGRLIWAYQINGAIRSSPALVGKTLCIGGSDNNLYTFEGDTGQLLWQFQTEKSITATPAIEGNAVYIGGRDGYVYALGVADGLLQWKKMLGEEIIASAAIGRGALCVGTRGAGIYALAYHSGEIIWHSPVPSIMVSSPLMLANVIFAGEYTPEGNLYALELESGKIVWEYALGAPIFSSPVLSGDKLLVGTEAGVLQVFDAQIT